MKRLDPATVFLLVCALVLAFVVWAQTNPADGRTSTLVITTANIRHTLGPARARHDLDAALVGTDLLVTQEMGSRRARALSPAGFGVVQPPDSNAADETAIAWRRSSLDYRGAVPILLHGSRMFGSATRYALAAMFTRKSPTGGCVIVVDVHAIPHIEVGGHPRNLPRLRLVDRMLDRLLAFGRLARSCALIIGGDWNVDGYADARVRSPRFPAFRLGGAGYRSSWTVFGRHRGTLGSRSVDGFYFRRIVPVSLQIVGGTYSDHDRARMRFR